MLKNRRAKKCWRLNVIDFIFTPYFTIFIYILEILSWMKNIPLHNNKACRIITLCRLHTHTQTNRKMCKGIEIYLSLSFSFLCWFLFLHSFEISPLTQFMYYVTTWADEDVFWYTSNYILSVQKFTQVTNLFC